ncbi:proton myo-inositol cotransporter isoform X5 [Varanus komodoensis]|uniref:proton myo-inositol cotransporter isoform X5 n=1 Tax=Varanus komodoensis TaxID=61221 RepID=UPI001CF7DA83|nr:proton myo-inositol cotransporter isoform X5 [Varanus komodoensis]
MSRKANVEYTLRSLSNLMGEKRRRQQQHQASDGGSSSLGERSLIAAAESCSSLNSQASGGGGGGGGGGGCADLERAARRQFQQDETPGFVYVVSIFSALGGFLFGYDTGVVSGALLLLKKELNLDAFWQELLVSSTVGAAAFSALLGGVLNGWCGRRICILLASFIFTAGAALLAAAQDKETLLGGRIVVGLGIGIASMTVPVYIAEVAPPHLRGRLVTINTLFITGGQFFASVIDGAFSYLPKNGWRYMLGLSAVPAVIQFFGFLFLPESPRWLIQKGQTQKARRILSRMRGNQAIDEEYDSIKNNIEEEEKEDGAGGPVIYRMLTYPPTRRELIVGCSLQMFQQLAGINTVMYYSATILQMSGVQDDRLAIWLAAVTAFTNFIFTLIGVWLVEKVGRRKLTLGSLAGTMVALVILALGFLLSAQVSPQVTLNPEGPSSPNSTCTKYSYCNGCMLDPICGFCYQLNKSSVVDSSCVPVNKKSTMEAAWGSCAFQCAEDRQDLLTIMAGKHLHIDEIQMFK